MRWIWHWSAKLTATVKGWRTIAVNAIAAILPILEMSEMTQILPPDAIPWYALAVALINMWLRSITTTPIGAAR